MNIEINKKDDLDVLNFPQVIFKDKELEVFTGQWFGVLSDYCGESLVQKFLKKKILFGLSHPEIKSQFGLLLKMAGVDPLETCILSDYDERNCSFTCHFKNAGDGAKMWLRYGDYHDRWPEFRIEYRDFYKIYDCLGSGNDRSLQLQTYRRRNSKNGLELWVFLGQFGYSARIKMDNYKLYIDIDCSCLVDEKCDEFYLNLEKIETMLLNTVYPLNSMKAKNIHLTIWRQLYKKELFGSSVFVKLCKVMDNGMEMVVTIMSDEVEKEQSFQKVMDRNKM